MNKGFETCSKVLAKGPRHFADIKSELRAESSAYEKVVYLFCVSPFT